MAHIASNSVGLAFKFAQRNGGLGRFIAGGFACAIARILKPMNRVPCVM